MGSKPVFLLLLDTSKALDKLAYDVLFNLLKDKSLCSKWLNCCMYSNQSCYVTWRSTRSDEFKIFNDVRQSGVISPLLFSQFRL